MVNVRRQVILLRSLNVINKGVEHAVLLIQLRVVVRAHRADPHWAVHRLYIDVKELFHPWSAVPVLLSRRLPLWHSSGAAGNLRDDPCSVVRTVPCGSRNIAKLNAHCLHCFSNEMGFFDTCQFVVALAIALRAQRLPAETAGSSTGRDVKRCSQIEPGVGVGVFAWVHRSDAGRRHRLSVPASKVLKPVLGSMGGRVTVRNQDTSHLCRVEQCLLHWRKLCARG